MTSSLALLFLAIGPFFISQNSFSNSSTKLTSPNQDTNQKLIFLNANNFESEKATQNITSQVGFKEEVSDGPLPQQEDLSSLIFRNDEVKVSYRNNHHGLIFNLAPVASSLLSQELVARFNHSLGGFVEVFRKVGEGEWVKIGNTGSEVVYDKRIIPGFELGIPLELSDSENVSYFLRRKSKHRFDAKVHVLLRSQFNKEQETLKSYYFFYVGGFVALLLYNAFLFFASRETIYLYYIIFGLAIHLTVLTMTGFFDYLLAPLNITASQNLILFSASSLITSMFFAYRYNNLAVFSPRGVKILMGVGILTFYIFFAAIGPWEYFFGGAKLGTLIDILLPTGILTMIGTAFIALRKGHILAKFYLISWLFMFIGALIYFGHYTSLIPRNFMTSHGVMWGNLLEMLIVSLGLAYKISILDREKKEAFIMAQGKREYERLVRVLLHDIANPLNLIHYYVELKEKKPDIFKIKEDKAWEKINFGISKIREIITFHREQEMNISQNFRSVNIEKVSLKEVVEHCSSMFEEVLDKKEVSLNYDQGKDYQVKAEKISLVNEVLNNLISNAIKFSYQGSTVAIEMNEIGDSVQLLVKDSGRGIEKESLDDFKKNEGIKSSPGTLGEEGTGYGLYLVKSYMDIYGGDLQINSIPESIDKTNHGTTVTLIFNKA